MSSRNTNTLNRQAWEQTEFPMLCETCLGPNPFVRMVKHHLGQVSERGRAWVGEEEEGQGRGGMKEERGGKGKTRTRRGEYGQHVSVCVCVCVCACVRVCV